MIYDYDVDLEDPNDLDFPTWHNRLLEYRIYDGDPNGQGTELLRTVSYTYYKTGQASNITVKDEGEGAAYDVYHDLALYYHSHGPLWRALWGSYTLDEQQEPTGYRTSWAREFFYDSPRQRYLAVECDTGTEGSDDPDDWERDEPALWTEYAGELPYRDRALEDDRDLLTKVQNKWGEPDHSFALPVRRRRRGILPKHRVLPARSQIPPPAGRWDDSPCWVPRAACPPVRARAGTRAVGYSEGGSMVGIRCSCPVSGS